MGRRVPLSVVFVGPYRDIADDLVAVLQRRFQPYFKRPDLELPRAPARLRRRQKMLVLGQPEILTIRLTRPSGAWCIRLCLLMPALRTNDSRVLSVVNGDVVSQEMKKRHIMSAIKLKLSPLQGSLQNFPQYFNALISLFVIIGHSASK